MELVTGLNMKGTRLRSSERGAEPLQIANYGIGGHFGPHCDLIGAQHCNKEYVSPIKRKRGQVKNSPNFFMISFLERLQIR